MEKLRLFALLGLLAGSGMVVSAGFEHYMATNQADLGGPIAMANLNLTPAEAQRLIQANPQGADVVILDVRTPDEFATGHLAEAVNLDYHSDTFRQQIAQLDSAKTYLIYCRTGVRSDRTLALMQELGFQHLYNLLGGIVRWQEEGFMVLM
ncbi:MAG: rhodanese-like domain-containing protein [Nodosilinea sp.]